jgi:GntR family transcriptional regulator
MFVRDGARKQLIESERAKFLNEEWPALLARIEQLGLNIDELPVAATGKDQESES